jgi:hypothetical protein
MFPQLGRIPAIISLSLYLNAVHSATFEVAADPAGQYKVGMKLEGDIEQGDRKASLPNS